HAPRNTAGGVAAELVVVVAAQAQLQVLRAELALVLRERRAVAATDGERRPRIDHVGGVAQPVEAGAQQLALGHAEVALQARAVAGGAVAVGEGVADVVVGIVGIAAGGQLQLHGVGRRPAHAAADDLLDDVGIVLVVAVVVVVAFGAERARVELPGLGGREVGAHGGAVVAVAVAVQVRAGDDEAAGAGPGVGIVGTGAGVDAVGFLAGDIDADAAALAADVDAGRSLAQTVAAGGDAAVAVHAFAAVAAAGEDLDHAADGVGAVQRRARSAHDLDALDLFQRDVLQRGQARGRRTDADAV